MTTTTVGTRKPTPVCRWLPGVLDPLPPDVFEFLGSLYGEVSPHGPEHWPAVWERLDAEHHDAPALSVEDLKKIETPTLLLFADFLKKAGQR